MTVLLELGTRATTRSVLRRALFCALLTGQPIVATVVWSAGGLSVPSSSSATASLERVDSEVLDLDAQFLDGDLVARARERYRTLDTLVAACTGVRRADQLPCLVDALFDRGGLTGHAEPSEPLASTASTALTEGRGTCAALVAVALDLSARHRIPVVAAVFGSHVLLADPRDRSVFFETLERGRVMSDAEARTRYLPSVGEPRLVRPERFAAFYLDNLGARWAAAGDPARARRALSQAAHLAPREGRIQYNYGTFLLGAGEAAAALPHLDVAARRMRTHPSAWLNRGLALRSLGREREARQSFERVLKIDPHREDAVRLLADRRPGIAPMKE